MKFSFALVAAVCFTAPQVLGQEIPDTNEVSVKDELEQLKAVVAGMQESATEQYGYVDFLRKIKISGYVQAQFRLTDLPGAPANFSGGAFPTYSNKVFQVRRGRIKVNYDNVLTQAVLQMDFVPSGFTLKDAFLSITEPWLQSVGLQIGVFDRPFGYEISFSSGWRETPERSRIFQTLFPGERDLGAKLFFAPQLGDLTWLRADVGIFNGSGANASEFDNFKDFIGRVAAQMPFDDIGAELDLGISGYLGHVRNNTKFLWQPGVGQSGERGFFVDSTITNLGSGVSRKYLGFEAQFYYDMTNIGGLTLRGEFISGQQPGIAGSTTSTISPSTQPTGALYRRNFNGWYLSLVQNIGNEHQLLLKYDVYDPNTDVGSGDFSSTNNLTAADIKFGTLGVGYVYHWDGNVKFVLYYEFVHNEKLLATKVAGNPALAVFSDDVRDNVFTFRVQYRFPN